MFLSFCMSLLLFYLDKHDPGKVNFLWRRARLVEKSLALGPLSIPQGSLLTFF